MEKARIYFLSPPAPPTAQYVFVVADAVARALLTPSDGQLAVQQDNDLIYEYSAGSWVIVAGVNVVLSETDSDSIDFTQTANDITAVVKLSANAADAANKIVALNVESTGSKGVRAQIANENIQDAAFGIVADTNSIDLTYDDAGNSFFADVRLSSNAADAANKIVALNIESTGVVGLRAEIAESTLAATTFAAQSISAAGTITASALAWQVRRVAGNAGAQTVSATTGITNGTIDGQMILVVGTDNTNTVTLANAGNVSTNGSAILAAGDAITLWWDNAATLWREYSRSA